MEPIMTEHAISDDPQATYAENRLAARILTVILMLAVLAAVTVAVFGLPALGIIGLIGTAVVWAGLLAITLGN
ncbi:hypothetical protein CYR75_11620 [Paracoccus jeotgali]|uniref:Uncharacterized protein n=2 Tax=Paracoccus jeotgali TaxID=2065379 RepID=A0A2K9MGR6_9RHOB|nr:hypothetical protein CYR75_11620 [Paracoccus jeotgali]